jgi:2-(1,2-epoxy-1,2-dihydrophenyl)acetyl-CoA isomerase
MTVLVLPDGSGVLTLRLERPDKRNAIDGEMMGALTAALDAAATDDSIRVVVLEGAGEHFCGGADIVARNQGDERADPAEPRTAQRGSRVKPRTGAIQRRLPVQAHRLIAQVLTIQVPVVCKVRGWAAGIGFQLALAADFAIAADDARFWEPFTERGFTPDSGATWLLPRRVGVVRARELLLLGRALRGTEAAEWGAIHRAVPGAELDSATDGIVARLASGPTVALGLTKWLLHESAGVGLEQQLPNEAFALELSSRTEDFREGLAAFREKREPRFGGR